MLSRRSLIAGGLASVPFLSGNKSFADDFYKFLEPLPPQYQGPNNVSRDLKFPELKYPFVRISSDFPENVKDVDSLDLLNIGHLPGEVIPSKYSLDQYNKTSFAKPLEFKGISKEQNSFYSEIIQSGASFRGNRLNTNLSILNSTYYPFFETPIYSRLIGETGVKKGEELILDDFKTHVWFFYPSLIHLDHPALILKPLGECRSRNCSIDERLDFCGILPTNEAKEAIDGYFINWPIFNSSNPKNELSSIFNDVSFNCQNYNPLIESYLTRTNNLFKNNAADKINFPFECMGVSANIFKKISSENGFICGNWFLFGINESTSGVIPSDLIKDYTVKKKTPEFEGKSYFEYYPKELIQNSPIHISLKYLPILMLTRSEISHQGKSFVFNGAYLGDFIKDTLNKNN